MFVKEIRLTNFQCYYEDNNILKFKEGLNIVAGSINKGKSKLFDAFYWVLFSEIFITGQGWVNTDNLASPSSFINDRAKFLSIPGDEIVAGVELELCHEEDGEQVIYTLSRKVNASYLAGSTKWYEDKSWAVSTPRVEISYTKAHNFIILETLTEFNEKVRQVFPKELRNYVWFQGEALDQLIDFSNKITFEQAIKHISYFPKYEKLSDIVAVAAEIIDKEKNKKIKDSTIHKKTYDLLEKELDKNKSDLVRAKKDLGDLHINHAADVAAKQDAEDKLNALLEFPPLEKQVSKLQAERKSAIEKISSAVERQKEQFQKTWILKGIDGLMVQAKDILLKYESERNTNKSYALPVDVPSKVYMEKMLAERKCLVCGTAADEKSDAYNYILNRISAQENHYKQMRDNESLYATVQQLFPFPDEVMYSVAEVGDQINLSEEKIEEAISMRNKANEELGEVQGEIDSLLAKYKISLSDGVTQSKKYLNKMTLLNSGLAQYQQRIEKKKRVIYDLEKEIVNTQGKINALSVKSHTNIPEIELSELASMMQSVVGKVKEQAKSKLVYSIEEKANEYYRAITKHNKAVDGKISIDPVTYRISRSEEGLYQAQNPNMGNHTLMKMCIINAMLSLNEQFTGTMYPFIADAPTSNLDAETTIAYVKSLTDSFGQSIIITKDISLQQLNVLKKDASICSIHTLETYSEDPSAERFRQYEAYTLIKQAK